MDANFYHISIKSFQQRIEYETARIHRAADEGDFDEAARAAHEASKLSAIVDELNLHVAMLSEDGRA